MNPENLSELALLTIKRSLNYAIPPFSHDDEPDNILLFHNIPYGLKDKLRVELETGGYIKEEEKGKHTWWVLSDKGIELAKLLRSYDKL